MKFLVTGGAGFIGSYITKALLAAGHSVRILDNLHAGSLKRLYHITNEIEFIREDIRDVDALDSAISGCDGIFHEAALAAVQESYIKKQEYHDVNVNGTKNILDIAAKYNIRVVYASSSSVYGNAQSVPIREDSPRVFENPYAATKVESEIIAQKYMTDSTAGIIGLRYFNVYGRGQTGTYAGVITQFMKRLEDGLPPKIYGDGSQSRDFVHVTDVAAANLAAMASKTRNGFFNVGTGSSTTIKKLAHTMIQIYELDIMPEYTYPLQGDVIESKADTSLATHAIPWKYSLGLKEGLSELIDSSLG